MASEAVLPAERLERGAPGNDETHAGHALEAFSRRRHQRIEAQRARVDGNGAIRAHRIDDQAAAVARHGGGDLRQGIQDPGAGFAMHLRDVGDAGIGGQRGIDARHIGRFLLAVREDHGLAPEITQDPHDAFAVGAIVGHEHLAPPRDERAERRLDGKCAAALQGHAHMVRLALDDGEEIPAHRGRHRVERAVPRTEVREHRGFGLRRGRQRAWRQQNRVLQEHFSFMAYGARPAGGLPAPFVGRTRDP